MRSWVYVRNGCATSYSRTVSTQELLVVSPCIEGGAANDSAMDRTVLTLDTMLHLLINERTRRHFASTGVVDAILPLLELEALHGPRTVSIKIAALSMVAYIIMSMDKDTEVITECA